MYESELSHAIDGALKAGELQQQGRYKQHAIDIKNDTSPVTEIDKACEEVLLNELITAFPADAFLGEESGMQTGSSGRCWIVDPLDGTRPYIRGIPTYSTIIALEEDSFPVVGVINLPALNLTCWAAKGKGAFLNGTPLRVSSKKELSCAMGSALGFIERPEAFLKTQLLSLMKCWDYSYGFMDAFSYVCLAEGKLDVCVNLLDKPWDCAAAACIITEAGGTFSDIHGEKTVHNGSFVASNGFLHQLTLDFFRN
jgi:histidinol-phosphatase